jgi:hypothetical protein
MALLRMQRLGTLEGEHGLFEYVLYCVDPDYAGNRYARVNRAGLPPEVINDLGNGLAVELELDPDSLLAEDPQPK